MRIFNNDIDRRVKRNLTLLRLGNGSFGSIYDIIYNQPAQRDYVMSITDTPTGAVSLTYGECGDRIEELAGGIYARLGCDSYLGVYADTSVEWLVIFWAVLRSGNKPFLINLRQPKTFTEELLAMGAVKTVIGFGKNPGYVCADYIPMEELIGFESVPDGIEPGNELVLTTSGTTLKKKLCIYTGECFRNQIENSAAIYAKNRALGGHYKGQIYMLAFLPFYHIFGLAAQYMWFCFFGVTLVFPESLEPETLMRSIRRHHVTHIFAVPLLWHTVENTVMRELNAQDAETRRKFDKAYEISMALQIICPPLGRAFTNKAFEQIHSRLFGDSIRFCITGGSYIRDSALALINVLGYPLYNGYGMTETGITSVELSKVITERMRGTIGKPFPTLQYKRSPERHLLIKGNVLCSRMIVDGAEVAMEEWFDTGDLAGVYVDGEWTITGRDGDTVKCDNGEKLSPDAAEACIIIPSAANYCVMGDRENTRLILIVQSGNTTLTIQREKLVSEVKATLAKLPPSYIISKVYYTASPIMSAGAVKVSRAYLRRELEAGRITLMSQEEFLAQSECNSQSAADEVTELVRCCAAELLGVDTGVVSDSAHFINDLGGNSLDYFSLLSELENKTGVRLPIEEEASDEAFGYSIAEIADALRKRLEK